MVIEEVPEFVLILQWKAMASCEESSDVIEHFDSSVRHDEFIFIPFGVGEGFADSKDTTGFHWLLVLW